MYIMWKMELYIMGNNGKENGVYNRDFMVKIHLSLKMSKRKKEQRTL